MILLVLLLLNLRKIKCKRNLFYKYKEDDNVIEIYVEGNGFLYNMVRIIVGALIDVGLKEELHKILSICLNQKIDVNHQILHQLKDYVFGK